MDVSSPVAELGYRLVKLPRIGAVLAHLGGTFEAIMRGKPDTEQDDYAIIVPQGSSYERPCAWGGYRQEEPGATCQWDGQANTRALVASAHEHPAAEFCAEFEIGGDQLYLPSLRELKALFASGCKTFDPNAWYWSSTQFARGTAFYQDFGNGSTGCSLKSWEGGRARAVRRVPIESLIS